MVRELFEMARTKKACLIFFDEIDAIGGARFDDGAGGDNEVQRTMLELINQLDGFDPRGNIKVNFLSSSSVNRPYQSLVLPGLDGYQPTRSGFDASRSFGSQS